MRKYFGVAVIALGLTGCMSGEDFRITLGDALLGPGQYPLRCDDLYHSLHMGESLTEALGQEQQNLRNCGHLDKTETPGSVTTFWHFPGGQMASFTNGILDYKSD